ncbi:MAG TPA: hypothetical protein LFW12_05015 [Rickettsia endosymbiont of Sericostoma sp. HW-2014]|nr:hypothetical protein [Rickettsia endosymbiont of Sericostoma sp. HW-2014]
MNITQFKLESPIQKMRFIMKNLLTIILTLAFSISAFAGATSEKKDSTTTDQQEETTDAQDPSMKKKDDKKEEKK